MQDEKRFFSHHHVVFVVVLSPSSWDRPLILKVPRIRVKWRSGSLPGASQRISPHVLGLDPRSLQRLRSHVQGLGNYAVRAISPSM